MRTIQEFIPQSLTGTIPVAIYTRVSTTSQVGGRFDSCESQAAICREYIAKPAHEGWHEVACFTDAAYSGATLNRPGIQALKRQIEQGLIRVVLIFKLERVLRSTDEWAPFRAILQQHDCRLISTTEDLSEDTPSGRLKNNLLVSVAEYERLNTAEKVRAKMLAQAKRGYWNYGAVPYGYAYSSQSQMLTANDVEAVIVRRVFESAAQLTPLGEIAEGLNTEGLRTRVREYRCRDGTVRQVGGRRFRSDTLRSLIRNSIYLGKVRFHGREYPGLHPALVTEETWEKANAVVAKAQRGSPWRLRPADKHFHLLKGLVFCAACGRAMVPHANGKKNAEGKRYRYYTCGHVYRERESARCGVSHISASGLERVVIAFLSEIHRHEALLNVAVEKSRLRKQTDREPLRVCAAEVQTALARVGQHLRNCVDAITAGGADLLGTELRDRALSLRDEKQQLLVRAEQVRQELLACDQDGVDAERVAAALGKFGEVFANLNPSEQKAVANLCLERIEIRSAARRSLEAGDSPAGARLFALCIKLPLARLVEGLAQRLIVQRRGGLRDAITRTLTLSLVVALGKHGVATILEPVVRDVGAPWKRPCKVPPRTWRHAIHQAIAWRRSLDQKRGVTAGAFAREIGVSRASLDFHLLLLRLAPTIQCFLKRLSDRPRIQHFGLIRMGQIARLPVATQHEAFARLEKERVATTPFIAKEKRRRATSKGAP